MKKLIVLFVFCLVGMAMYGQTQKAQNLMNEIEGQWKTDENKNLVYQQIIEMPGIDKSTLYQRAENYFIYNYKSGKDVIQTKDKDQGLIIGSGYYTNLYVGSLFAVGTTTYNAQHILRIDIKEEKVRIILTVQNYVCDVKGLHDEMISRDVDQLISQTYPLTMESTTKTSEAKAFYELHKRCMNSMSKLTEELKNGTSRSATDRNW